MKVLDFILGNKSKPSAPSNRDFHNKIRIRQENRGFAKGSDRLSLQKSIKWDSSYNEFKESVDYVLLHGLSLADVRTAVSSNKLKLKQYCEERGFVVGGALGKGICFIENFIDN